MARSGTNESGSRETGSILRDLGSFFTSVQTTVTLLFFLAAASVIGTVMPQEAGMDQFYGTGGASFYNRVSVILDLHNVYQSWWFILLLVLLASNLLGCLIRRLPAIPREWRGVEMKSSFAFSVVHSEPPSRVKDLIVSALEPLLGKSPAAAETPKGLRLIWVVHRVYLFGFPLIHLAIVVILLGGLIGLVYGFRGNIQILEGESLSRFALYPSGEVGPLPFSITLETFTLARYPTGEPKEYRSDVTISKNGKEALRGSIRVNHPLTYEGISLYQSDYKLAGVKEVKFEVVTADGKSSELAIRSREPVKVPDTPYNLRILRTDPPGTTRRGAGIEISLEAPGEQPKVVKLFRKDTEPFTIGGTEVRFLDYQPLYLSGLQIGSDPGAVLVWAGCSLLIAGFMLTLFTNLRRLHIELETGDGGTHIRVAGRSRRQRREFRQTVEATLRTCLKTGTQRP